MQEEDYGTSMTVVKRNWQTLLSLCKELLRFREQEEEEDEMKEVKQEKKKEEQQEQREIWKKERTQGGRKTILDRIGI